MTLSFLRHQVVEVEPLADGSLAISGRLVDSLTEMELTVKVRPPDLEIARSWISRHPEAQGACLARPKG
jgi:hypothetical protein